MDYEVEIPEELAQVVLKRAAIEGKSMNTVILEALARELGIHLDSVPGPRTTEVDDSSSL
ncbi:MAG: hypothetical protein WD971_06500 [Pirellulales bacterium]